MATSPEQALADEAVDLSKPLQGYKGSATLECRLSIENADKDIEHRAYDAMAISPEQTGIDEVVDLTKPLQGYKGMSVSCRKIRNKN